MAPSCRRSRAVSGEPEPLSEGEEHAAFAVAVAILDFVVVVVVVAAAAVVAAVVVETASRRW